MAIHLSTGFEELDAVINGLNGGELVLIGGRPAMGKTTFALNIALNVAKGLKDKERSGVAFFSMEQSASQLTENFLSAITQIPTSKIRKGEITPKEFQRIAEASENLKRTPLYIDDTPALTIAALHDCCQKMKDAVEKGLGLVIIDYLQLFNGVKHSLILQRLKEIATKFDVPVIVLSQLVRTIENRKNKRPRLSDIPACKDLSAVDKVLFLYRESYYLELNIPEQSENETDEEYRERFFEWNERLLSTENNYEIIIAKNPAGQCGTVNLRFNGKPT